MATSTARTSARVWGTPNAWSLAPYPGATGEGRWTEIELEIRGEDRDGYHLVLSPAGFSAADYWYATRDEAVAGARELLEVEPDEWSG